MSYNCGVSNCGGGKCVHKLLEEKCPFCLNKMVEVITTGFKFCAGSFVHCGYEIESNRGKV